VGSPGYLLTDDGLTIAQAIRDGTAIGISDESFKDGVGTASWVLEGSSPCHRIRGDNIVPGDWADQSSHRSELSGLYGITLGVYALSEFYKIDQAIEVGVTALPHWREDSMKHRTSVLLAIRNIRARCPAAGSTAMFRANNRSIFLDRWALLNIDMDLAAKVHWHRHAKHRHRPVWKIYGEARSLWIGPRKLCRNLRDQIVDFIQGTKAKEYWDSRNRFGQGLISSREASIE
jgi:hypothetical protein